MTLTITFDDDAINALPADVSLADVYLQALSALAFDARHNTPEDHTTRPQKLRHAQTGQLIGHYTVTFP